MDIIKLARELGAAVQADPDYAKLCAAREANDADEGLQKLIEKFNLLGMTMEMEAGKNDADEKKVDEINSEMMALYSEILDNKTMQAFNEAKDVMDKKMDDIVSILAAAVNGEDPMTFDPDEAREAHEHADGCTGDCCSCGGCH